MATISAMGASKFPLPLNRDPGEPVPDVFGQSGENGWYINDVAISFNYDPDFVDELYYYLNDDWHLYTSTFFVTEDGNYIIGWYWTDRYGKTHDDEFPIMFKIDQTPPTITLSRETEGNNKVIFTATCNDDTSLVGRVEFYLDDDLITTDTETPYKYTYIRGFA